uniref:Histone deacetylase n=1 Tax=Strigamia maritima TaxID=126957 RepID=T1JJ77_STRMM
MQSTKIAYITGPQFLEECDRNSKASVTHELISAYKLLTQEVTNISPQPATEDELKSFHSEDYIQHLKTISKETIDEIDELQSDYGYDCPVLANMFSYASTIAGGTISGARCLAEFNFQIAINWCGGWHHAKKDEAAGFCYVNDIVLGILVLRRKFKKILYVDLDVHHGDGSGDVFETGCGPGKNFTVNVPLKDGIRDAQYFDIFSKVMTLVRRKFEPDAIVCQCGVDGLAGDPMEAFNLTPVALGNCIRYLLNWKLPILFLGRRVMTLVRRKFVRHCGVDGLAGDPMEAFNLTPVALGNCIRYLLNWKLPILFLGGGGYNVPNAARCWTYLTSLIVGKNISNDIPDNHVDFISRNSDPILPYKYHLATVQTKTQTKTSNRCYTLSQRTSA